MAVEAREDYDTELLRQAADGDEHAREHLFDLHGAMVWSFAVRLCGEVPLAREVAREAFDAPADGWGDASSALLASASRAAGMLAPEPAAAGRGVMPFAGLQQRVSECNARLPTRQREVLALRALAGLSYDEMAAIMDLNRAGVAQLIARARLTLAEELRGTPLVERSTAAPECSRAVPLMAMRIDGQLREPRDREWLDGHLATCQRCAESRRALHEADLSYRAWLPAEAPLSLRAAVTGFDAAPAARFERSRYVVSGGAAPRRSAAARWRRRTFSLAVLGSVTVGLGLFAVQLFESNQVVKPARAQAAIAGAALPTPEPYRPDGLEPEGNFPPPSKTPKAVIQDQKRDLIQLSRQIARREKKVDRKVRQFRTDVRKQRAARREAAAKRRAATKRREREKYVPNALEEPKGIPEGDTEAGGVQEDPSPSPSPTSSPEPSPSASPSPSPSPSASPSPSGTSSGPGVDEGG